MWQCRKSRRNLGPKKLVLFPDIGRVIFFFTYSPTSQMCIRIYIFNLKKTNKQAKKQESINAKETKEEKRISL